MVLLALACSSPKAPADVAAGDTADTTDTAVDTGPLPYDCSQPPDPARPMATNDLLARLEAQRCLAEDDIAAVEALMADQYERSSLFCDSIYRLSSPDGLSFAGTPERVVEHASVPDVAITDDGTHTLVYNDIRPGLFVELLRTDPERFWRQGLLGYGGVGMSVSDGGAGFSEVLDLDLALDRIQEAVDPDIGRKPDGTWHIAWFGIHVEDMTGGGPLNSLQPHKFFRAEATDLRAFTPPVVAVASSEGSTGGVDPTVLDLADGGEILFVGPLDNYALGWSSPDGAAWDPAKAPDVPTEVPTATPDAMPDPTGGYRMHYMRNGDFGNFEVAFSEDGATWTEGTTMVRTTTGFNPSVARAPDGTWWLYFNQNDAGCL